MTATSQAIDTNARGIRPVVARHPVAAMLIAMFTISYALLIPPALAGLPLEPFLLGVIFLGQLLPAGLVTAASNGPRRSASRAWMTPIHAVSSHRFTSGRIVSWFR